MNKNDVAARAAAADEAAAKEAQKKAEAEKAAAAAAVKKQDDEDGVWETCKEIGKQFALGVAWGGGICLGCIVVGKIVTACCGGSTDGADNTGTEG